MLVGMSEQIAVRLTPALLAAVDEMVARGSFASRAAAIRAGTQALVDESFQRSLDDAIVAGYQRVPPTEEEEAAALASVRQAILEEPW